MNSRKENDLASCTTGVLDDRNVSLGSICKREAFTDDGPEGSTLEASDEGSVDVFELVWGSVVERDAVDLAVAEHEVARVDLDVASVADDDDATEGSQHGDVLLKVDVGQHLQDDVDAPASCQLFELLQVVRALVVQGVVRSVVQHELAPGFGARGGDDRHADGSGQLDGSNAHAS